MKKTLMNIGGIILLYLLIVVGVLLLNARFAYLNTINSNNNYITLKN